MVGQSTQIWVWKRKRKESKDTVEVVLLLCDVQIIELILSPVCTSEHFSTPNTVVVLQCQHHFFFLSIILTFFFSC